MALTYTAVAIRKYGGFEKSVSVVRALSERRKSKKKSRRGV